MKVKKNEILTTILAIVIGNSLMAFSYVMFVIPGKIVGGGSGGIGIILNALFGIDPAAFISIFMATMFLLGFIMFGKDFSLKTLPSVIIYPAGIFLFRSLPFLSDLAIQITNPLVAAIFGGMCFGVGGGLIYRVGGSSGGTDIPAFILAKYAKINIDKAILGIDATIILSGLILVGFQEALIGIIMVFIASQIIDRIMYGGSETMMMLIISERYEAINEYILHTLNRGSTLIPSIGSFSKEDRPTIQVVISRREFHPLELKAKEIDPQSFIIVLNAKQVYGRGFTISRGDK